MLYILLGTDEKTSRAKLHELCTALVDKKPDASFVQLRAEDFDPAHLSHYISGQGLFESKQIVVLDHLFENKEYKEIITKERKALAESPNIFFLLEGVLDKPTSEKLKKVAEKFEVFGETMKQAKEKPTFNTFALADALGARNRKTLWTLYQEGKRAHVSDEEMHGVLFWQAKSLLLAEGVGSAGEAGLNPFVFRKAKNFLKNYTVEELRSMLRNLTKLPHEARRGRYELGSALEQFVLTV